MDTQKMLMSVAKVAIGWAVGLWMYKSFMSGASASSSGTASSTSTTTPTPAATPSAFSADGDDY